MTRLSKLLLPVLFLLAVGGCRCVPGFDAYAGFIDRLGENPPRWDALYSPCLDVTRIGRPDWCACGFNRVLGCCRCRHEACPSGYGAYDSYYAKAEPHDGRVEESADSVEPSPKQRSAQQAAY